MLLSGKSCLVTGAATRTGIGFATARLFAENGGKVAIVDLDEDKSAEAAAALPGNGHCGLRGDVTDRDACRAAVNSAAEHLGGLEILVNNAGVTQAARFQAISQDDYDLVLDVNLRGTFNMCQAVLPLMIEARGGSIVNISSAAAQKGGGFFGGAHYAAAKAGILGLTKAIAREFARDGIRSNAICPSMVETEFFAGKMTEEKRAELRAAVPVGRLGRPLDVARACLFLASDLAEYVTGSELDVNGGTHIH